MAAPRVYKSGLQLRDRRAFHHHVRIAPAFLRFAGIGRRGGRAGIYAADVDPSGDAHSTVHNKHLPVVALRDRQFLRELRGVYRIELSDVDPRRLHAVEESRRRAERAHRIVHEIDVHALGLLADQEVRHPAADVVVAEDVRLEIDVVLRCGYGIEHGLVRLGAVHQEGDFVPCGHRVAAQALHKGGSPLDEGCRAGARLFPAEDCCGRPGRQRPSGTENYRRARALRPHQGGYVGCGRCSARQCE